MVVILRKVTFFLFMLWALNQHSSLVSKVSVHTRDAFSLGSVLHLRNLLYFVFPFTLYMNGALNPNSVTAEFVLDCVTVSQWDSIRTPMAGSLPLLPFLLYFHSVRDLPQEGHWNLWKQMWLFFMYDAFFSRI